MAGLFTMADGSAGGTAKRFGASQETADLIDNVQKPPPPPPEPAPPAPEPAAEPPPAATPPPPEAPAAPPPAPPPEPAAVTPAPDPYAAKRGEVQRLAQARAKRARTQATIIGSDTLG
jgi:outer membrane biosynthesis protein TonB